MMKTFEIVLRSVTDVLDFVMLASTKPYPVTVGNEQRSVNGKSFMQIFCLDLKGSLQVKLDCSEEQYHCFYEEARPFLA